jgi:hypothetical protein
LPIWSSPFSGPVRAVNAEDQRPATSSAHHGHDWPGSRHLQDCDGVPSPHGRTGTERHGAGDSVWAVASATRRFTFRWTACAEVPNPAHGRRWHKWSARPLWLRSSGIRRSKLNSTTSSRTAPHRHVHGGASRGDGTGRAGHASVSCPLVQPGRPVDLRSLPTGNVDIALNTVRARKRTGARRTKARTSA